LYTTKNRFHSSMNSTIVNVATIIEFFAMHLLLCKPIVEED
jgi:hypothetical protein